jgi:phosphatidylglycerophosphate synthase
MPTEPTGRRPLKTRDWPFFKKLAAWLARSGVTPNMISFSSIVFGVLAGASFAATAQVGGWPQRGCWLLAAVFIQLRLIANLLDGMVAVEGGKGGPTGELWNEAPDRIADAFILIGAGYAAGSAPGLGWAAALVAVFVAYVRALGASVGSGQVFLGPMAKPHRMALMTVACIVRSLVPLPPSSVTALDGHYYLYFCRFHEATIFIALLLLIVGGLLTSVRRLHRIAAFLRTSARA